MAVTKKKDDYMEHKGAKIPTETYDMLTEEELDILSAFENAKSRRSHYENLWQEYSFAYQRITNIFRSVDPDKSSYLDEIESTMSDIHLPVEFAVITRKVAEFMKNLPKWNWISRSKPGLGKLFTHLYNNVWYGDEDFNGDFELLKAVLSAYIYGDGFLWVFHEYYPTEASDPIVKKDGTVSAKKLNSSVSRTIFRQIDIRDVYYLGEGDDFYDGSPIVVVKYMGEEEAKTVLKNYKIDWDSLPKGSRSRYDHIDEAREGGYSETYEVKHYYNPRKDEYFIIVNNRIVYRNIIPLLAQNGKKMAPVVRIQDHVMDGELYSRGESWIVRPHREIKNNLTNLVFDVSRRTAFPPVFVDPFSDFDENDYQIGDMFIRAEPERTKQMQIQANLGWVNDFYNTNENQMIVSTGVNHLDTANVGSETATKSMLRSESQLKLVELNINLNTRNFIRLGLLLKNLIRLHYRHDPSQKRRSIRLENLQLKRDSKEGVVEEPYEGTSYFDVMPKDLEEDVDLKLEVGNVALTTAMQKELQMQGIKQLLSLPPEVTPEGQQKLVYKPHELAKIVSDISYLPSTVLANVENSNDLEKFAQEGLLDKPLTDEDITNPAFEGMGRFAEEERRATEVSGRGAPGSRSLSPEMGEQA